MPEISVIVPVYNTESHICRCIDSILAQTYRNFELILVDDGSLDASGKICDQYVAVDSRIRVIHQENQGQAAARNNGVMQSEGKWLHFVDSDDLIHPQMLELLYQAATETKANIVACDVMESDQIPVEFNDEKSYSVRVYKINERSLYEFYKKDFRHYWIVWAKLIHKEIVENNLFTIGRIYEDNAIMCQWMYQAKDFAYVPQQMYFYQKNPSGTTKGKFSLRKLDYLWALEEQIQFYKSIKYKKMMSALCSEFLTSATNYYHIVENEQHDDMIEKNIKRNMFRIGRKYFSYIRLSRHDLVQVIEVFFPNVIRRLYLIKLRIGKQD